MLIRFRKVEKDQVEKDQRLENASDAGSQAITALIARSIWAKTTKEEKEIGKDQEAKEKVEEIGTAGATLQEEEKVNLKEERKEIPKEEKERKEMSKEAKEEEPKELIRSRLLTPTQTNQEEETVRIHNGRNQMLVNGINLGTINPGMTVGVGQMEYMLVQWMSMEWI